MCRADRREGRARAIRLAASASAVLVLAATSLAWGALCIGSDGHVALEAAAAGDCFGGTAGSSRGAEHLASELQSPWTCCGPCTDLTGAGASWLSTSAGADLDPGPVPAAAHSPLGVPLPRAARSALPVPDTPPAAPDRAFASTVIRC